MARANLSNLLGNLPADRAAPIQESPPAPPSEAAVPAVKPAPTARVAVAKPEPAKDASYLGFVRKDVRLREDQLEALTVQARRLNRAKRNTGIRITENTLIRIAIDLLLDRVEKASGEDEAALLKSVRR